MKIDAKHPQEREQLSMFDDNVSTLPMPTDMAIQEEVGLPRLNLVQQFSNFDFLLVPQPLDSLKIEQVDDDLQYYRDNFLNDNIRSILTFANVLTDEAAFNQLLQLIKLLLRRKFAAPSELVVLIKCCFLFRRLIQSTAKYSPERRMRLYRELMDPHHNHYHSGYTSREIIDEVNIVQARFNTRQGFEIEELYPFSGGVKQRPHESPLYHIYVGTLLQVGVLELLHDQFPSSLDVFADIQKFIDPELVEAVLPTKQVLERVESYLLAVPNDSQSVSRQQIEHILKCTEQLCSDSPNEKRKRITEMELHTASCFLKSPSMDKKLWALSLINDKIRLLGMGDKYAGVDLTTFLDWLQSSRIYESLIQQNVHPEVMARSSQLVRFLYEKERLIIADVEDLVHFTLGSESDSLNKLTHCLIIRLEYKHLEKVFDLLVAESQESKHLNASSIKLLESIISAQVLNQNDKKNKRKRTHSAAKEERKEKLELQENLEETKPDSKMEPEVQPCKTGPSVLVSRLFGFVMEHLDEYPLIHLVGKLIVAEPLIFSIVPQEIVAAIRQDRPNSIALLDSVLKLTFPIGREKGTWTRQEFVAWLASEGIFEYLLVGIARNRFDRSLSERLSLLALLGKYYKPFEKGFVEQLWKILGLRAIDDKHRQQFFLFVRECLVRGNNEPLFTEEAINFVYFGILMKLHARWFNLKIYECFEMFFLRVNQDCRLLNYINGSAANYQLLDPQLIGLGKFWYIYLTGEDSRVVRKCKDFLTRLLSKFECEQKVFLAMKNEYVTLILEHIRTNLEVIKNKEASAEEKTCRLQVLARCLEMLIKIIEDLEGKRLSGDKPLAEELTINISNVLKDMMPPKTFTMKIDASLTLKQLREAIGQRVNPPKKGTQIRLMTQGRYLKGENLTLKEMKIDNKQHFVVDAAEETDIPQKLDEKLLEDMKLMFPQHSEQLIRHVLYKRHGQDEQTIAEALLDDEAVARYNEELQQPVNGKMISELLSSSQNIFEAFFEVLNVQDPQLSLLTWRIISNIPDNPYHTELVRETILKTNDWNEIVASGQNCFKTLYNLQLLRGMLVDPHGEDQQLKHKFVENGGFDHVYQTARQLMQKWRGDPLEAKLLTSLLQVVKLYMRQHLQSLVNKNLNCIFKEVVNYRAHLKDIAQDSTHHIIDEIVTPENNTVGSREKSFSFKGKSSSSRQTPSNQTPNFQSLNNSRSNSPHSERPNDKDSDNMSSLSGSKTANIKHADSKRSGSVRQDSFSKKMQEALNLNLQLHHYVNVQELVTLLMGNIATIARGESSADNEDVCSLWEELFDLLLPSLLVTSAFQTMLSQQDGIKAVVQGVAISPNSAFRERLVYMIFLLCVISDILDESRIMVEDDDELFMTTNTQRQGPKIHFIQQLLPLFQTNHILHESYFTCLTKLLKQIDTQQLEQLTNPQSLLKQAVEGVLARPVIEEHDSEVEDSTLSGLLALILVLLERYKHLKKEYAGLVGELFGFLFHLPQSPEEFQNIKNYPRCKRKPTRRRCLSLLTQLARDNPEPREQLLQLILKCCENLSPKEFESTVMRTERYPGLRNLGATCYINSLLQQLHKNTLLGPMLCTKELIQIAEGQPLYQLARLMSLLSHSLKSTIHPGEFIKSVRFHGGQQINPLVQQDVNEFFMAFVDLLEKNGAQPLLNATLYGEICNELTGEDDLRKFVKKGIEQFYTISLDIKGKRSLQEALQYYIKADQLDGDNMYFSEELNKKVRATKRSYIRRLPNSLVFTLKRFQFDYNTMLRYKLNDYLEFPMQLDMLRYSEQHLSEQAENIFDEGYYKYRLAGVLVHSGTAESGHYYSYIREADKWWEFNDSVVTEFNIANLKAETFGGEDSPVRGANDWEASSKSRNAYLLFYERVTPIENEVTALVKDHQIKGEFMDLVWRENLQFLRSRLVFDADFLKFLEDLYEAGKDKVLADVLARLQEGRRRDREKEPMKPQETPGNDIQALPLPAIRPDNDVEQQKQERMVDFWESTDIREDQSLLNQMAGSDDVLHQIENDRSSFM